MNILSLNPIPLSSLRDEQYFYLANKETAYIFILMSHTKNHYRVIDVKTNCMYDFPPYLVVLCDFTIDNQLTLKF